MFWRASTFDLLTIFHSDLNFNSNLNLTSPHLDPKPDLQMADIPPSWIDSTASSLPSPSPKDARKSWSNGDRESSNASAKTRMRPLMSYDPPKLDFLKRPAGGPSSISIRRENKRAKLININSVPADSPSLVIETIAAPRIAGDAQAGTEVSSRISIEPVSAGSRQEQEGAQEPEQEQEQGQKQSPSRPREGTQDADVPAVNSSAMAGPSKSRDEDSRARRQRLEAEAREVAEAKRAKGLQQEREAAEELEILSRELVLEVSCNCVSCSQSVCLHILTHFT
jgi:hypothetical protein